MSSDYLEVWGADALAQLAEEWVDDLLELIRLDDVQDLLHLAEEHHLLQIITLIKQVRR